MKELKLLDSNTSIGTNFPSIALITVVYNNIKGIEKTISSVLSQTYPSIEYIIIDGGSTDGTVDIIKKYESYITYWHSEPDKGIYDAMNKGINIARSDYVMFLNSGDDFFENNSLEKIVQANREDYDIVYNKIHFIRSEDISEVNEYPAELFFEHFIHGTVPHPATLIKKKLFETIGLYDDSLKIASDWKWFLIAIMRYKSTYKYSEVIAANFYMDGISCLKENEGLIFSERAEVFEKEFNFHLPPPQKKKKKRFSLKRLLKKSI